VDQLIPHFRGVVSCLPFNILVAAPQTPQGDNVRLSTNGRITITAEPAVINATAIAVEDGILTLSVRDGFFSKQPINFTVRRACAVAQWAAYRMQLGPVTAQPDLSCTLGVG
jgi:hypothetical protein